ncbi:hypothetical protein OOU_Y34scaffold00099g3 [Pyricularia oryzae Y34]|uniref:Uncharacterized protein n=3 Tax=Pyricularia oryzae TaxID=318829 RepID=A0A4P7NKJ3_PYROR|nr:hypothetical protein OOU_Y34scaffold00099g3 [Pyricularia oryzae Y34]QBZ62582.1 hypothetical protein PoMZ_11465 [Pyricularia oryzae]
MLTRRDSMGIGKYLPASQYGNHMSSLPTTRYGAAE